VRPHDPAHLLLAGIGERVFRFSGWGRSLSARGPRRVEGSRQCGDPLPQRTGLTIRARERELTNAADCVHVRHDRRRPSSSHRSSSCRSGPCSAARAPLHVVRGDRARPMSKRTSRGWPSLLTRPCPQSTTAGSLVSSVGAVTMLVSTGSSMSAAETTSSCR
jgi:hypothetical protein